MSTVWLNGDLVAADTDVLAPSVQLGGVASNGRIALSADLREHAADGIFDPLTVLGPLIPSRAFLEIAAHFPGLPAGGTKHQPQ